MDVPEAILRLLRNEAAIDRAFDLSQECDPELQAAWDESLVTLDLNYCPFTEVNAIIYLSHYTRSPRMISPELLRRFPFFAQLTDAQLRTVAMISDVHEFSPNQIIFEENKSASCLFFVIEGCVDLCYHVEDETKKDHKCEVTIETICAGDPFGISSLIEPFQLQLTARSSDHSKAICINGQRLKAEFEKDPMLELALLRRMAKAAIERLHYTRIKLAASYV